MNNYTENNNVLQDGIVLFQLIVYIPALILGIPLNLIAFWAFCCRLKMWTETKVYMINLIIADISLLFTLPFLLYLTKYTHPSDQLCFAIRNIYFTNMPMSIFIITLIAIDRYIAIKFPLKAKIIRSPLKSASICGFLWIILIIYSNFRAKLHQKSEKVCFWKQSPEPSYSPLFPDIFVYFILFGIVTFCSVQVIRCLKKKMATSSHETKLIQKAMHIVSVNLCVFIVCFSPFYIALLLHFAVNVARASSLLLGVRTYLKISSTLANCNCCLDAFCYYYAAKEFPEFSSMFLSCISMRSKVKQSQESQPPTEQIMA